MGLGLVVLAFFLEVVAVPPRGIHVYGIGAKGYRGLTPGISRVETLEAVNGNKAIRVLQSCAPDSWTKLTSRHPFAMTEALQASDVWVCRPWKGNPIHLIFDQDRLEQVIMLRTGWRWKKRTPVLQKCLPRAGGKVAPELYLDSQTVYPVFHHPEITAPAGDPMALNLRLGAGAKPPVQTEGC